MPSRAQRLQAEMDASTAAGSFDLDRLMASPVRNEDIETDSVTLLEDEVEAATTAAFSGDLNLTMDDESANLQQPADHASSSTLPPLTIAISGGSQRRVKLQRPVDDVSIANSSTGSSVLPITLPRRIFTPGFGGPASPRARTLLQERLKAAGHRSGSKDQDSQVDGEEAAEEEEGMDVVVVAEEKEEAPIDPEVDKDSPEVRIQRKQARWYYHRNDPADESESLVFKAFSKLNICCNSEKELRSSATQCELGFETLDRRQGRQKKKRDNFKEARRVVQASRKNLTPTSHAAAANSPATSSTNAASDRQTRPALVHPPNQQRPDPRDETPNPKRRRQEKRAPAIDPAHPQQQQQQQQQPKQQQQHQKQQRQQQQQQLQQQQLHATANNKSKGKGKNNNIKKKQQLPPQQQEVPSAAAIAPGSGGATASSAASASKKAKELKQRPGAAAAQGNPKGDIQPPAGATGSTAPKQPVKGPTAPQQQGKDSPTPSSTVLDIDTGHRIDEHLLRLCATTPSNASKRQLQRLASSLPPTYYQSFSNAQRVECARQLWDMAEKARIEKNIANSRRQAMIALDAKVKSDTRVTELEKQLETARKVADAKAKEAAGFQQTASAAASVKHVVCIQQDPRAILAPVTATTSSSPAASAESKSRPPVSSTAQSDKDAPKTAPKKKRRPWNPGRQQQQQQDHQQPPQ